MKRYRLLIFLSLSFFIFSALPVLAQSKINKFDVRIKVKSDSSFELSEKIEYEFRENDKHGIFREIPVNYRSQFGNFSLKINNFTAKDQNGKPYKFEKVYVNNNVRFKVGDPDKTVTGKVFYDLSYTVTGAINYFKDHDELYWNVVGDGWNVYMEDVTAAIELPESVKPESLKIDCFSGEKGKTEKCKKSNPIINNGETKEVDFTQDKLFPQQGFTIVVGFPKGILKYPTWYEIFINAVASNPILLLPIVVFALLFYLWFYRGRDPKGRGTIIPQYDVPDKLTPAEAGVIMKEKMNNKIISSEIINLAVKGYLKINRLDEKKFLFAGTDYMLLQLKKGDDLEGDFEKELMVEIFKYSDNKEDTAASGTERSEILASVKLSDLKDKFYKDIGSIKEKVYFSVSKKGYFQKNPETVRRIYIVISLVIIGIGLLVIRNMNLFTVASVIMSGVLILVFSTIMPKRTKKGVEAKEYLLGLKEYLKVAEKDRLNFHNAPEKNPKLFEKLLPFAMVFGVEKEWAKQFEGLYNTPPSWYNDPSGGAFSSLIMINSLNNFSQAASSTLTSSPSSAAGGGSGFSGGFSGGGFGGGGGGSW